jgi:hypothetical protein
MPDETNKEAWKLGDELERCVLQPLTLNAVVQASRPRDEMVEWFHELNDGVPTNEGARECVV